jgi:transcriptional repressor NrdR
MVCPFCLHKKTHVYNSRFGSRLNQTWRRRRCLACEREFTTYESADSGSILQLQEGRTIRHFSSVKLMMSLLKACDHRLDVDQVVPYLCGTIEQDLYKQAAKTAKHWISKQQIIDTVSKVLRRFDSAAYIKYISSYQQGLDGPTIRRALRRQAAG